jgi:hypothetical protein
MFAYDVGNNATEFDLMRCGAHNIASSDRCPVCLANMTVNAASIKYLTHPFIAVNEDHPSIVNPVAGQPVFIIEPEAAALPAGYQVEDGSYHEPQ